MECVFRDGHGTHIRSGTTLDLLPNPCQHFVPSPRVMSAVGSLYATCQAGSLNPCPLPPGCAKTHQRYGLWLRASIRRKGPFLFMNGCLASKAKTFEEVRAYVCWRRSVLKSPRSCVFHKVNTSMTRAVDLQIPRRDEADCEGLKSTQMP